MTTHAAKPRPHGYKQHALHCAATRNIDAAVDSLESVASSANVVVKAGIVDAVLSLFRARKSIQEADEIE